jgi:hypothetical protein
MILDIITIIANIFKTKSFLDHKNIFYVHLFTEMSLKINL